ncbi:MAG: nicotinate-nucleotide adenylyltransferase [Caulobacteraceae bacterium]|nr:nicotinate-nucleotide adenylyltransferase [Caulobacteraceae bacterium]
MTGRLVPLRLGLHLAAGMRVGLYGGSFDPAHGGHRHVARTALRRLGLDRVVWLVSLANPLKAPGSSQSLERRRLGAARQARGPGMVVSDAERRLGSRYTIDTVRRLKARFPTVRFVWIMGADNLADFHRWKAWTRILAELPLAVIARPGFMAKSLFSPMGRRFAQARLPAGAARRLALAKPPAWIYLAAPLDPASSTALRVCA